MINGSNPSKRNRNAPRGIFCKQPHQFWKKGITRELPERWKKVIEQNGSYINAINQS